MMLRVLFLDIDGVLNSNEMFERVAARGAQLPLGYAQIDRQAALKVRNLVERTDATVVLSSTWRFGWPTPKIAQWIGVQIYGVTPILKSGGGRGREITRWLDRVAPVFYAIIDDDADAGSGNEDHFVRIDPRVGLTDENCLAVEKILMGTA